MFRCLFLLLLFFAFPAHSQQPTKIGALLGLTGPLAQMSVDIQNGLVLATEDLAMLRGIYFRLLVEDSKFDLKETAAAFQKLSDVNGVKIFFISSTGPVLVVKPLSEPKKILVLGFAGYSAFLKDAQYMLNFGNDSQNDGMVMARAIIAQRPRRIASMNLQSDWADGYRDSLNEALGRKITLTQSHLPTDTDFRSTLKTLLRYYPDIFVVNSTGPAAGLIIRQLYELGYRGKIFANHGLILSSDAVEIVKNLDIRNLWFQTFPAPSEDFTAAYKERFHSEPMIYSEASYTFLELLADAIDGVGNDNEKIVQYVKQLRNFQGRYMSINISPLGSIIIPTMVEKWPAKQPAQKETVTLPSPTAPTPATAAPTPTAVP